jgi:hypothetical protein
MVPPTPHPAHACARTKKSLHGLVRGRGFEPLKAYAPMVALRHRMPSLAQRIQRILSLAPHIQRSCPFDLTPAWNHSPDQVSGIPAQLNLNQFHSLRFPESPHPAYTTQL